MTTTSVSLLDRLKCAGPASIDWQILQQIYLPLIRRWLARVPGLNDEADDLAQEVFLVVVREIGTFERQRCGSFRAWLRLVTVNRARAYCAAHRVRPRTNQSDESSGFLDRLENPADDLSAQWDREHDRHVFDRLLATVRADFAASTWEAFERFALRDIPASQVARELGTSENAVLLAKSRILKRLREEANGLVD